MTERRSSDLLREAAEAMRRLAHDDQPEGHEVNPTNRRLDKNEDDSPYRELKAKQDQDQ